MTRLTDVNELVRKINKLDVFYFTGETDLQIHDCQMVELGAVLAEIDEAPTVDAVEVVHGWWEDFCRGKMCCCSVCKAEFDNTCNDIHGEWHYCPNCGAKMDLE